MKKVSFVLIYFLLIGSFRVVAQESVQATIHIEETKGDLFDAKDPIYTVTDTPAIFSKGGNKGLGVYLKEKVQYPTHLLEANYTKNEEVFIRFVIEKDGKVSNLRILTEGNKVEFLDVAQKVVSEMPSWIPAKLEDGTAVRQYMTLPIKFCPEGCGGW